MITNVSLPQELLNEILRNLDQTLSPEDEYFDLNIVTSSGKMQMYVTLPGVHATLHELWGGDNIDLSVSKTSEICMDHSVLKDLVQKAGSGEITVKIASERYIVESSNTEFSTPISFSMRQFSESDFQPVPEPENATELASFKRVPFLRGLDMMSSVSSVVNIKTTEESLVVSASDRVKGDGQFMEDLPPNHHVPETDDDYSLAVLRNFLDSVTAESLTLKKDQGGQLIVELPRQGMSSYLMMSKRI